MERIQAAIQKAKERRSDDAGSEPVARMQQFSRAGGAREQAASQGEPGPAWAEIEMFEPDAQHMAMNRIVTFADTNASHVIYDMMRTKILRMMEQNGWRSIGITSPTAECGKTTTVLNLAFSMAHQEDLKTVLVDLDLRRPAVARQIGLKTPQSMASVLQGNREVAENFVRVGDNLAIGTNTAPIRSSAEIILGGNTKQGVAAIRSAFKPDIMIYDLPPMLVSDDVMAFLPHLDCVLLIAAAERTRMDEVDKCEQDLAEQTNVMGVVLNKCRYSAEEYGYY